MSPPNTNVLVLKNLSLVSIIQRLIKLVFSIAHLRYLIYIKSIINENIKVGITFIKREYLNLKHIFLPLNQT